MQRTRLAELEWPRRNGEQEGLPLWYECDVADIRIALTLACRRWCLNLDETRRATCLTDPVGGSSSSCDTKVMRIEV